MRRLDDQPIDPDVVASLDAIDAALAGEPVDPSQAELAELALLLAAERPALGPIAAESMDARVRQRFGEPRRRRSWWLTSSALAASTALAAVVMVVLVSSRAGNSAPSSSSASSAVAAGSAPHAASSAADQAVVPQPPAGGRKIAQSAQLQLSVAPSKVDQVAQEAFDVVGAVHGVVQSSNVTQTGGSDGYAYLQLSVPSAALGQAMTQLSRLPDAQVTSRTDALQDVTDAYAQANRRLSDAQALRTSLLRQLANAATQQQVDSLQAQLRDAEAAISSAQAALGSLNHQINFSPISLTINARDVPVATSSGFTIGKAAHDARRVLVVTAGAALIALAALLPVALLIALGLWIAVVVRRHRREQALDAA